MSELKLSTITQSKLSLSVSGKDALSLHRWVLLKNSILNSPSTTTPTVTPKASPADTLLDDDDDDDAVEVMGGSASGDRDAFMFPDVGRFMTPAADAKHSEAQWLDSLLETLGDDEDDDDFVDSDHHPDVQHHHLTGLTHHHHHVSTSPPEDDDFALCSPMSSSDDLISQPNYCSQPSISVSVSVPYSVSYQPYQPPLGHAFHFSTPYEDPLPYYHQDELEDFSVPDSIEDTSDDESDAPATPSLGRSRSSLSLADSSSSSSSSLSSSPLASPSSPSEGSRLRHVRPRVYVDPFFDSFEIDPLPFPAEHLTTPYNHHYQEFFRFSSFSI